MDEQAFRTWWPLHLRVAKGEELSTEEQEVYAQGKDSLRAEEMLEGSLLRLRQTREEIKILEAERERLQEHRQRLRERVAVLETALSEREKQALGVGD